MRVFHFAVLNYYVHTPPQLYLYCVFIFWVIMYLYECIYFKVFLQAYNLLLSPVNSFTNQIKSLWHILCMIDRLSIICTITDILCKNHFVMWFCCLTDFSSSNCLSLWSCWSYRAVASKWCWCHLWGYLNRWNWSLSTKMQLPGGCYFTKAQVGFFYFGDYQHNIVCILNSSTVS